MAQLFGGLKIDLDLFNFLYSDATGVGYSLQFV